jgi:hypothetical protein
MPSDATKRGTIREVHTGYQWALPHAERLEPWLTRLWATPNAQGE